MADVLVIADDLTGANATGAAFARVGLRAVTASAGCGVQGVERFCTRFDVVVVSTDTRHRAPAAAAARVAEAVHAGWPVRLVCKRVDTTLRGNVGAEAMAARDAVAALSGRRVVVVCAPAHPMAGRLTVEGHQLLHGRRLEDTELAHDARSPMRTSQVAAVLAEQAVLRTAHLPLSAVTGEAGALQEAMAAAVAEGAEVVIADSLTEEHLDRVAAAAVATARDADVLLMSLDPGPGSLALARAMGLTREGQAALLLAVSGSATDLTRQQLSRLVAERDVTVVEPVWAANGGRLLDVPGTVARLDRALEAGAAGTVLLATALREQDVVRLDEQEATRLPAALGEVVRAVAERHEVDGLYTTGGDVTAAVLDALHADGLEVEDEVVPLAVTGRLVGGAWDGLPVVTKGGLVGDAATAVMCCDMLTSAARARARRVPAAGVRSRDTAGRTTT